MTDYLEDRAQDELKRVDHLIYVSLKYTRTCDVMLNAMKRMISAFELGMNDLLFHYQAKKKIKDIPDSSKEKVELLEKLFKNKVIKYTKFYSLLKKIETCEFSRREEYRKHVTMIAMIDGKKLEIDIITLLDYYKKTKEFVDFVKEVAS